MQMPPLSVIASWPRPNHDNPITTGPASVIITCTFYPIVCIITALRCYTRLRISMSFGWDDWLILGAMVPTTAFMCLGFVAEWHLHWNRHIWDVRPDTLTPGLKIVMITQILFSIATTLTKLSMLALVYRIVTEGSKKLPKVILGIMAFLAVECVLFCFVVLFQCRNPSTYWTLSFEPQPKCISETGHLLVAGIINTIGDLVVVILPIPIIWRLRLPIQQQIIIILLFGAGILVSVASVLRTYYLYKVTNDYDKTWNLMPAWITSSVELYVGIMCASIPATKKFFSRFSPRLFGTLVPSHYHSRTQTCNTHLSARDSHKDHHELELGALAGSHTPVSDSKQERCIEASPALAGYSNVTTPDAHMKRSQTPSAKSGGWDGMDDLTRVDSDDELVVDRCHKSPPLG